MVEHAVQYHTHPTLMGGGAQGAEVSLCAQQRVDGPIVAGVVAVVAGGLKNGVQIQRRHTQARQIVQLLRDALQRAAKEVAVGDLPVLVRKEHRLLVPAAVQPPVPGHMAHVRHGYTAEPIREDLVRHAAPEPVRGGGGLVYRQLPACRLLRRVLHAIFAVPYAAPVHVRQPETVPAQLTASRRGVCAGEAALRRRQGARVLRTCELPEHQQLAAVVGVVRQRKAHFGAAGDGAEGVFIMFVSRIEIGSHVCLLSL